ncbi:MAG TPA: type II toxin-antitoxin system VapB family antitoxin [Terracidiphilus sp.]|jgi:Arc/MetJ family transcription regulator|nr:type II toxin-antitoxin system VapB family antitoxin [Terracidiphilus sp.]
MRTNIEIDDKLMRQAMKATGASTKKAAVELALRKVVQFKAQTGIKDLFGKIAWRGPDDDWFASDEEIFEKRRLAAQKAASSQPAPEKKAARAAGSRRG